MVNVIIKDGKFLVKGTFNMGIAGLYENREFMGEEGLIAIEQTPEELLEELEEGYYWTEPLEPYFKNIKKDNTSISEVIASEIAEAMEKYINNMEETAIKNIKQINNYFWYQLLSDWMDCETPFWEHKDLVLKEYRDKYTEEDYNGIYKKVYENTELISIYKRLGEQFERKPNDGSMEKTDAEALIRQMFPMFDFDKLISIISPDCMIFSGGYMLIQFTDETMDFFCSAYEKFDETFTPHDWHNF